MLENSSHENILYRLNKRLINPEVIHKRIPDFPSLNMDYIARMSTSVGIMQHGKYSLPNYEHGYCLDDNARAVMLLIMVNSLQPSAQTKQLLSTYLSYINYMSMDTGKFKNFLSMDHNFLDKEGTEDSFGRTIYALGFMLKYDSNGEFNDWASEIFFKAIPNCLELKSIRSIAYSLLGLNCYIESNPDDQQTKDLIEALCSFITKEYELASIDEWQWYEQIISYDNAIIPLSLLRSGIALGNQEMINIAYHSALFLDSLLFKNGYLTLIGNSTWLTKEAYLNASKDDQTSMNSFSSSGQQPIEIPSLILLYKDLYALTNNIVFKNRMIQTFEWFFGKNSLEITLYDPISKGCSDGLDLDKKNKNQGAESTISFWCAHLYLSTQYK